MHFLMFLTPKKSKIANASIRYTWWQNKLFHSWVFMSDTQANKLFHINKLDICIYYKK